MSMLLSRKQVRDLDRRAIQEYGMPGVVLMENAGRGCAELLRSFGLRGPVIVCCGKGNNGGDGFVIARHLDNMEVLGRVLLFAKPEELSGDAAINYQIIAKAGLAIESAAAEDWTAERTRQGLAGAEWIIDALFGTGLTGPVRPPLDQV